MGTIGIQELVIILIMFGVPLVLLVGLVIWIALAKRSQMKKDRRKP